MNMQNQAALWRSLAQEARAVSATLRDCEMRLQMLVVAASYELLAARAEAVIDSTAWAVREAMDGIGSLNVGGD